MMNGWKNVALIGAIFVLIAACAAPSEGQVVSPKARAACKFADGKTITVNYSSPRVRGRKIFGDLVPFGEVWRAGADEATSFVTNTDVIAGGKTHSSGQVHFVYASDARQMDLDHQQAGRRVGYSLSRRKIRFRARGDENFQASVAA